MARPAKTKKATEKSEAIYTVENCVFKSETTPIDPLTAEVIMKVASAIDKNSAALIELAKAIRGGMSAPFLHIGK